MNITEGTLVWALLGGFIPAFIWLWFWLKEDARHPEPARLIMAAFVGGMLVVPIALFAERYVQNFVTGSVALFIIWSAIEEILKFFAAYFVAFRKKCIDRSKCLDEAIDPIIYMITAALGFAAVENMLFLIQPLATGEPALSFITADLRFIGAMVLHVVASGAIGVAMGFAFYKNWFTKKLYLIVGIFTAIVLHSLFNLSIIMSKGGSLLIIFGFVWVGAFILLALFEKIKRIKNSADINRN